MLRVTVQGPGEWALACLRQSSLAGAGHSNAYTYISAVVVFDMPLVIDVSRGEL